MSFGLKSDYVRRWVVFTGDQLIKEVTNLVEKLSELDVARLALVLMFLMFLALVAIFLWG